MLPLRFQKLKKALINRQHDLTVLMDNVHKPHNMAAILRSCEAVGISQAHIVASNELHYNKPKAAAGVLRWIDLHKHQHVEAAIEQLKNQGMKVIAAHPCADAMHFRQYDYTQPTAIVMGTERTGLTETAIKLSDELVSIPINGLVQSLNVSVSAALILYEAQRQREQHGMYKQDTLLNDKGKQTLFEWAWPRVARYCQKHAIAYPEIDMETGQIINAADFRKQLK